MVKKDPDLTPRRLNDQPNLKVGLQFVRRCERAGIPIQVVQETSIRHTARLGRSPDTFDERLTLLLEMLDGQRKALGKPLMGFKIMRDILLHRQYQSVLPRSLFLHIVRDPRDVVASQMVDHASWGYRSVDVGIKSWNQTTKIAHQLSLDGAALVIRYEDLVSDIERTLNPLFERLNLRFDPVLYKHHEAPNVSEKLKQHPSAEQVAQPVSGHSIGRFRADLRREQIAAIERGTRSLANAFGYDL